MSTLGIDFGTSFSSASYINAAGKPEAVEFNSCGSTKLPSMLYFAESGDVLVGTEPYEQVKHIAELDAEEQVKKLGRTVSSIKRKLSSTGGFRTKDKFYSNVELVSLIIRQIREEAIESCPLLQRDKPTSLVLTHPAVMPETQKQLLKDAARQAGFEKIEMLPEPVSAAIGYVQANNLPNTKGVIVYDFGGGTFDVAYVYRDDFGEFRIPFEPTGEQQCGGDDIDNLIYDKLEGITMQKFHRHISPYEGIRDVGTLMRCRDQKEALSLVTNCNSNILLPLVKGHSFERVPFKISREEFNSLITPVIDKTVKKTKDIYDHVKENRLPVDFIVLIGGSSRIPLIKDKLAAALPDLKICTTGTTDTAVALGASYYKLKPIHINPDCEWCYCAECGKKILKAYKFCIYCGKENYMYGNY